MINKEPIRKRNIARAIALYGTFGGLFLNCETNIKQVKQKTLINIYGALKSQRALKYFQEVIYWNLLHIQLPQIVK